MADSSEKEVCQGCGAVYSLEVTTGCPVCGLGLPVEGHIDRDNSYGGHKKILNGLVQAHAPIKMGELYRLYTEAVEEPRSKRTVRSYLNELDLEGELNAVGTKSSRLYKLP